MMEYSKKNIQVLKNIQEYEVILASNSPRRKHLLEELGIQFRVQTKKDVPEEFPPTIAVNNVALYLALQKANSYKSEIAENQLFITADTVVVLHGEILNKPDGREDAIKMIQQLSGQEHKVITGVCITNVNKQKSFSAVTKVHFKKLSQDEIHFYVENYKPFDKAGAYGIQEWIGYIGIDKIEGSYFNVMGLPVQKLYEELKNW